MKRSQVCVAVVAMLAVAWAAFAADGVMLQYKFEAGKSERHKVSVNQTADMGGAEMSQLADMEVTVNCLSVTDGKGAMQITFDKVDATRAMFGNQGEDPMATVITGKSIAFTADATGKVTDIKPVGYFEGWDQYRAAIEPIVKRWYIDLPGKTVTVGEKWSRENEKEEGQGGIEIVSNSYYQFKEMKQEKGRQCALVTGDMKSDVGGSMGTPMGAFEVVGEGTGKFEFLFDAAAGTIVKLKGKIDLEMDMTPASGGDATSSAVTYHIERELL